MSTSDIDVSLYKIVYDWARYANKDLGKMLDKKHIGKTFELIKSRKFRVLFNGSTPSSVIFDFLYYGKFVDMGVGKGWKLGDLKGNQTIYKETGIKGRKATKWYSKTIFPEANTLAKILAEEFGIQAINMVNENIDNNINLEL